MNRQRPTMKNKVHSYLASLLEQVLCWVLSRRCVRDGPRCWIKMLDQDAR